VDKIDWQLAAVFLAIAAAMGYLGWRVVHSWAGRKSGCGGGCACNRADQGTALKPEELIRVDQLTVRTRRDASSGPI
jgi:hypothetical protein